MFKYKLVTLVLIVSSYTIGAVNSTWDLAVAINDQIELLSSNGTLWKIPTKKFHELKALTYNFQNEHFIVSDMNSFNDTIYAITADHDETSEILSVVEDLPDDVQGLAIDPFNNTLYWTDSVRKNLFSIPLSSESPEESIRPLVEFHEEHPQDLTIDICKRMIFWTNSNLMHPTIERSTLDGTDRKILVNSDLFMPSGITIDQVDQRLYWADMRQGIYYSIESMDFNGDDRRVLYNGTHQKPFGLAVDKDYVYWTDIGNNALWRKNKFNAKEPEKIRKFNGQPMGLVARNLGFPEEPDCRKLQSLIDEYKNKENRQRITAVGDVETLETRTEKEKEIRERIKSCVYGKVSEDGARCMCDRGYTGESCDTYLCYNHCLNDGHCDLKNSGEPICYCKLGFAGERCESAVCNDFYCLNGGVCNGSAEEPPKCVCADGYRGDRCQIKLSPNFEICKSVCQNNTDDFVVDRKGAFICNCYDGSYASLTANQNSTNDCLLSTNMINYVEDPVFIGVVCLIFVFFVANIVQYVIIHKLKHKRPRIKKRIVVNKNVTPLTYRPQSTIEQCEITIEDCCNMNVCETPCFEPPDLRNFQSHSKKDDKKSLLANMERSDDHTY